MVSSDAGRSLVLRPSNHEAGLTESLVPAERDLYPFQPFLLQGLRDAVAVALVSVGAEAE
jgi:hypothetical protein